jgi:unsaturated rhamnogalacturonyl hydrolase
MPVNLAAGQGTARIHLAGGRISANSIGGNFSPMKPTGVRALIEASAKSVASSLWLDLMMAKLALSGHRPDATPRCARLWQKSLRFFTLLLAGGVSVVRTADAAGAAPTAGVTPLVWSQRLAASEMTRRGDSLAYKPGGKARWDYAAGLFTLSLLKLNEVAPDARYVAFATNAVGSFVSSDGVIATYKREEFQLDAINPGRTLLALSSIVTNLDERYFFGCAKLVLQFEQQPRTPDGGFWHKQRYTNQMWLDGIYMAEPFYVAMGPRLKEPEQAYTEAARQFRLMDVHTYDAPSGLNYHGWDALKVQPWADPRTGCSSNFWGRAEGWYAMALVDVLENFPTNHPARGGLLKLLQKTAKGIVKWQDAQTGVWWQVMDAGERPGNYREATASAMFVYALAKGVNHGWLSREYIPAIEKGYVGILKNFIQADGEQSWSLTHCCAVAGLGGSPANGRYRDGSFEYYVSEPVVNNDLKGVGPFILAGIEVEKLR